MQSLVHVSSAYVNSFLLETKEQIYPAPANVDELLKLSNELDTKALEAKSLELLKDHPNSYTFTKHLAEHEVVNGKVPAGIVRPSMSK